MQSFLLFSFFYFHALFAREEAIGGRAIEQAIGGRPDPREFSTGSGSEQAIGGRPDPREFSAEASVAMGKGEACQYGYYQRCVQFSNGGMECDCQPNENAETGEESLGNSPPTDCVAGDKWTSDDHCSTGGCVDLGGFTTWMISSMVCIMECTDEEEIVIVDGQCCDTCQKKPVCDESQCITPCKGKKKNYKCTVAEDSICKDKYRTGKGKSRKWNSKQACKAGEGLETEVGGCSDSNWCSKRCISHGSSDANGPYGCDCSACSSEDADEKALGDWPPESCDVGDKWTSDDFCKTGTCTDLGGGETTWTIGVSVCLSECFRPGEVYVKVPGQCCGKCEVPEPCTLDKDTKELVPGFQDECVGGTFDKCGKTLCSINARCPEEEFGGLECPAVCDLSQCLTPCKGKYKVQRKCQVTEDSVCTDKKSWGKGKNKKWNSKIACRGEAEEFAETIMFSSPSSPWDVESIMTHGFAAVGVAALGVVSLRALMSAMQKHAYEEIQELP